MAALAELPVETLWHILRYVSVRDILVVRQTCGGLNAITRSRSVWLDVLIRDAFEPNIPVPGIRGRNLLPLDALDLEMLYRNTIHLHHNWTSPTPTASRTLDLRPSPLDHSDHSKVAGIHFLPGRGNRWLLQIGFYVDSESAEPLIRSTLTCWDLHQSSPLRCAAIDYKPERMAWSLLLVNSDPTHPVAFIVSRGAFVRSNESDIHKFMAYGVNEAHDKSPLSEPFKMLSQFPSSSHPRALHGSLLFFERNNETSDTAVVQARNVLTGDTMFMLRVPFSVADPVSMDDRVKIFLRLAVYDKYVIMFRTRRILLYRMPVDTGMGVCIDPIAAYQWQYRIDTVEYSIPRLRQSHPASRYPPPITLLVRFDSYYPWPVNLLHHFVIHPNPHFDPTVPTSTPYAPQPQPIAVIASPMRMFTPSDLILGPYGTAVWIDAQTDPDPTQAGDHGQRIAGRILASGNGEPVVDAETRLLQICETASKWGRLALDEEEGRIAVGHIDGRVTLFDYGRLEIVD